MGLEILRKNKGRAHTTSKKKGVIALCITVIIVVIEILLLKFDLVRIIGKYCARLENGSMLYDALAKQSDGVYLATYLFNVTNAGRFQDGSDDKLKVEEIGPFTYQEVRNNDNLKLDPESKTIWYSPRITTHFLPEKSIAHPKDLNVTMPNLAMLSMASKVGTYGLIPRMGFNMLTSRLKSRAIVSMRASDYLWGYDEPLIRLGHNLVPGFVNFDVLGVMDRLYDKKAKYRFEVSGAEEDRFSIKSVNGVKGLDKWGYNDPEKRTICNTFKNTYEGIAYPPGMSSDRKIRMYRAAFCRFLELDYQGTSLTPYGVEALEYKISNRTFEKNNETECLCSRGICVEGTSDLSPCYLGLPVVISHAHFWNADPKLYEKVEGIKPDEKKHSSKFSIDTKNGMVLETQFTIQVSILLKDVRFNSETRRFADMLVPVLYFKIIQPPIDSDSLYNLNLTYFTGPRLILAVQIILAVTGIVLMVVAIKQFRRQENTKEVKNGALEIDLTTKCGHDTPLMSRYRNRFVRETW